MWNKFYILLASFFIVCVYNLEAQKDCSIITSPYFPLTDFEANDQFYSLSGGLYGNNQNTRSGKHKSDAVSFANQVRPLNLEGNDDINGAIGFIGVGASNPRTEFNAFVNRALADNSLNPSVRFINTCIGGQGIQKMKEAGDNYWKSALKILDSLKLSPLQVQIAWIETDNTSNADTLFPRAAETLALEYSTLLQTLYQLFPNLKLCYLAARSYSGFATPVPGGVGKGLLHPRDYYHGWAVRFVVENVIQQKSGFIYEGTGKQIPFTTWANYSWTNGNKKRKDGFQMNCETDFGGDGLHLTASGEVKIGQLMYDFFSSDESCLPWFYKKVSTHDNVYTNDINTTWRAWYSEGLIMFDKLDNPTITMTRVIDMYGRIVCYKLLQAQAYVEIRNLKSGHYFVSVFSAQDGWSKAVKIWVE